jgi:hypothetical protein
VDFLPQPTDGFAPRSMVWKSGVLYYATIVSGGGIFAVDDRGGMPRLLTADQTERLWLDGDRLLYPMWGDQFFAVPLAGGPSSRVANGQTVQPNVEYSGFFQTIDADAFYWALTQFGNSTGTLWRMPRAGGSAQKLADFAASLGGDWVKDIQAIGDVIVVGYGANGLAVAVPKGGGPPQPLPAADTGVGFLGFDDLGALYRQVGGPDGPFRVVRTEANGSAPGVFWPAMPPSFDPERVIAAQDGWLLWGIERFSDRTVRESIWLVDAPKTTGRRIGCMTDGSLVGVQAAAASPSAVFLSVSHFDEFPARKVIVRIAR